MSDAVRIRQDGEILIIQLHRPDCRNAVDGPTATALADAFRTFDAEPTQKVAILDGGRSFCAGADLKAIAADPQRANHISAEGDGPMGPTRMQLGKPVIGAISGHCVAGGLELALWCDLRVADTTAEFGVYCRRFGVPLIDGGTVRLPRLIGMSRAMDMILTGRAVSAPEALDMGLINRLCPAGEALDHALALARGIASFPQQCMRNDRLSAYRQWGLTENEALHQEFALGQQTLRSGETLAGAGRFTQGQGRNGRFERNPE